MNEKTNDGAISDFDGVSSGNSTCKFCKLTVHEELFTSSKLCKSCRNYSLLVQINRFSKNLSFQIIIFSAILYFFIRSTRKFLLPIIIIAYLPTFLLGIFQYRLHYWKIPGYQRIVHQLKMYKMLNDSNYYYNALNYWNLSSDEITESLRFKILHELVESVLLDGKPNPTNLFKEWSHPVNMDESQFVEYLIANTSILDGLSIFGGTGLLPDIWPFITDNKIKEKILDILENNCQELENASSVEKKLFLEDLYLVEDELKEIIDREGKWIIVLEVLDEFVPETPPKNFLQQAQMLAAEQSKSQATNQISPETNQIQNN